MASAISNLANYELMVVDLIQVPPAHINRFKDV